MTTARLRAVLSVDNRSYLRGMDEAAIKTDAAATSMDRKIGLASRRMGGNLKTVGTQMGQFGLPMGKSATFIGKKLDETGTKTAKFGGMMKQYGGMAALAVAGVAFEVGKMAVQAAVSYQSVEDSLKTAVVASNESWNKYADQIHNVEFAQAKLGFSATDVAGALAKGVIATQSVTKSTQLMTIAENLAAFKHIALADAMMVVVKSSEGNLRALKQLGIDLPITATSALKLATANHKVMVETQLLTAVQEKAHVAELQVQAVRNTAISKTYSQKQKTADLTAALKAEASANAALQKATNKQTIAQEKLNAQSSASKQIIDAVSQRLRNQAFNATQTAAGKMQVLNAQWTNAKTAIGGSLLPGLVRGTSALSDMLAVLNGNWSSSNFMDFLSQVGGLQGLSAGLNVGTLGLSSVALKIAGGNSSTVVTPGSPTWNQYAHSHPGFLAAWEKAYGHGKPPPGYKAMGGPVSAGSPYIVGERGPELMVPSSSGMIVPNHSMGSTNVVIHVHSADPQAVVNALARYCKGNGRLPSQIRVA